MVRRILTGAGYGLTTWIWQRITSVIMLISGILFIGFFIYLTSTVDSTISSWQKAFGCTFVKVVFQITFLAILLHAWVGVRDLWMDYIKSAAIRLLLHTLTFLWLIGSLIYSVKVIWS